MKSKTLNIYKGRYSIILCKYICKILIVIGKYIVTGNLTYTVKRVWLTKEEWDQLKKGFVNFVEAFPVSEDECVQCTQKFIVCQLISNFIKISIL